jgi:hypothetical protein
MKPFFILLFIISISLSSISAQIITIAEAIEDLNGDFYPDKLGDTVTVQGINFSPNFAGNFTIYYVDDGTAATRIYHNNLLTLNLGDEVQITGIVDHYIGITYILVPDTTDITIMSTGNPCSEPIILTLAQYLTDSEAYEGSLIAFCSLTMVSGTWPLSGNTAIVQISDGIDTLTMNIDKDTDIGNYSEPTWPKDIVGIGYQYSTSTPPNDGYQLYPRFYDDFLPPGTVPVELTSFTVSEYVLDQNYPNPFNPSTNIKFVIPKSEKVKIEIFNLLGQKTKTLLNKQMPVGSHEVEFTAKDLPSGVYLYRIEAGEYKEVKKMILLL